MDYAERVQLARSRGLAIWDVLQACERETSADADIVQEQANDFEAFLAAHPGIQAVFFNGQAAASFFKKYVGDVGLPTVSLPSTSPANARMRFEEKREHWAQILTFLD